VLKNPIGPGDPIGQFYVGTSEDGLFFTMKD
jgi:hypothetical protein